MKKEQVNETLPEPEKVFKTRDTKKYKVKTIIDSAVYGNKANN